MSLSHNNYDVTVTKFSTFSQGLLSYLRPFKDRVSLNPHSKCLLLSNRSCDNKSGATRGRNAFTFKRAREKLEQSSDRIRRDEMVTPESSSVGKQQRFRSRKRFRDSPVQKQGSGKQGGQKLRGGCRINCGQ